MDGGGRGVRALVLAGRDDELAGDPGDGSTVGPLDAGVLDHVVEDLGASSVPTALAGGGLAFERVAPRYV